MSFKKDGIPNILDSQIDDSAGEEFFEGSIDLQNDTINIPTSNNSDDFLDEDNEGDIIHIDQRERDFTFKKACKTCQLCLDDPQIHEVYRDTNNMKKVEEYIINEYSSTMEPPTYLSIRAHIQNHFLPIENKRTSSLKALNKNVDRRIAEIENTSRANEVNRIKAMASLMIDESAAIATSREVDAKLKMEHIRIFNQTARTIKDYIELELKCLGLEGGVTPEEMEDKIKNYIAAMVKEFSDPEEAKKFIEILKKANIQL